MTWYADGSPYVHTPGAVPPGQAAFDVGWLDDSRPFPQGESDNGLVRVLRQLCCEQGQLRTRGGHPCPLSHPSTSEVSGPHPVRVPYGRGQATLGSAELRLVAVGGQWLVAPDLVFHYVTVHSSHPPDEFIETATAGRVALGQAGEAR